MEGGGGGERGSYIRRWVCNTRGEEMAQLDFGGREEEEERRGGGGGHSSAEKI